MHKKNAALFLGFISTTRRVLVLQGASKQENLQFQRVWGHPIPPQSQGVFCARTGSRGGSKNQQLRIKEFPDPKTPWERGQQAPRALTSEPKTPPTLPHFMALGTTPRTALSWLKNPKDSRESWGMSPAPAAAALGAVTSARPHLAAFLHQSEPQFPGLWHHLGYCSHLIPSFTTAPTAPEPKIPAAIAAPPLGSALN